jgi:uncharacterized phage protein gp47/JayE
MPVQVRDPYQILIDELAYLQSQQSTITDLTLYSPERILYEAYAIEASKLWWALKQVEQSAFIKFARGADLDTKAEERGIIRRVSAASVGTVTFSRTTTTTNQNIPVGTRLSTPDGILFLTTASTDLLIGESSVSVPIRAASVGVGGNVLAGRVTLILDSFTPALTATNPSPTSGGVSGESDLAFRDRAMQRINVISRGSKAAYEQLALEASPNVLRALASGQIDSVNSVLVTLVGINGLLDAASKDVVLEYLEDNAGLTDDLSVEDVTFVTVDVTATLTRRPGYSSATVETNVEEALESYLDLATWPFGQDVLKIDLVAVIENALGVFDVDTSTFLPSATTAIGLRQLPKLGTVTLTIREPS